MQALSERILKASVIASVAFLLLATACSSLSKPPADRSFYAISTPMPTATTGQPVDATLRVRSFRVASPYAGKMFIYQLDETRFQEDFHNAFIADPSSLLTGAAIKFLRASGVIETVVGPNSITASTLSLEGSIDELYGDFSDPAQGAAVLSAAFFVLDDTDGASAVIYERRFDKRVEFDRSAGASGLAKGWNTAWFDILNELANDLKSLEVPSN